MRQGASCWRLVLEYRSATWKGVAGRKEKFPWQIKTARVNRIRTNRLLTNSQANNRPTNRPDNPPSRTLSLASRLMRQRKTAAHLRPKYRKRLGPPAWPNPAATRMARRPPPLHGRRPRGAMPRRTRPSATIARRGQRTTTMVRSSANASSIPTRRTLCRSGLAADLMAAVGATAAAAARRSAAGLHKAAPRLLPLAVPPAETSAGQGPRRRLSAHDLRAHRKAQRAMSGVRLPARRRPANRNGPNPRPSRVRPIPLLAPATPSRQRSAAPRHRQRRSPRSSSRT